jgi:Lon protease-like protein
MTLAELKAIDNGYATDSTDYLLNHTVPSLQFAENTLPLSNGSIYFINPEYQKQYTLSQINKQNQQLLDLRKQGLEEQQWTDKWIKTPSMIVGGLSTLGNLWLGLKQYGIAKKQLGLAKEQWNMTKQELNRIRTLRDHLTQSYMNGE